MPPVLVGEGYSEELSCAVCLDSWKDPEELLPCGHIFCKGCSQTLTLCPTCRETIQSRKTPNRTLINMALQVEVRCMSCGWRGSRESSARHTCDSSTGPQPATQVPPPTSNLQSFNLDALWAAPSNSEHQWTSLGPSAPSPASSNPAQPSVAAQPSNYMESHLPETRRNTQGGNSPGTVAGSPSSYPPYLQPVQQQTTMVAPPQQPQHQPKPKFSQYPIQYQQQQSPTPSQAHTHAPPGAGYAHYSNPSLMVPNQMPQGAAPPVSGSPGYYTGGSPQAYSYGVPQQAQQQQQQQQYRPSPPRPTSAVSQPPPQRAVSSVIEPHGQRPWALYDLSQEEYDQIVSLFVYFDEDESGKLDKREVARLAQWLNFARTPAEVDRMFNVMDVNHSGSLSVGEFLTWLRHNRPNPKALYGLSQAQYNTIMMQFRTYDTNQDGFICMKEFTDMVMNLKDVSDEETAHNLFQMVDTNRDGYINLHEFLLFRAGR